MISHRSQMDDENMTCDVSEENKSIVCRRLYVMLRLPFFFSDHYFTIPSTFINDLFLSSMEFVFVNIYVA